MNRDKLQEILHINFPDEIKFLKEQLLELDDNTLLDKEDILLITINSLIYYYKDQRSRTHTICIDNAFKAIKELVQLNDWPGGLKAIVITAMEGLITCFKNNKDISDKFEDISALYEIQLKILNSSISELKSILNNDWVEQNHPQLFKHQ